MNDLSALKFTLYSPGTRSKSNIFSTSFPKISTTFNLHNDFFRVGLF